MNKYLVLISIMVLVFSSCGNAALSTINTPDVQVSLLKYTPYPAEPGNYATLTFKIENMGSGDADNVILKLVPEYPFSVDNQSLVTVKNSATPLPLDNNLVVSLGKLPAGQYTIIEYTIRVAPDSLEGAKQITLWHQPTSNAGWIIDKFNVQVEGTDNLEVSNVVPSILTPGEPTNVVFVLNNTGTAFIRNIKFMWNEKSGKILPLGSGNIKYVTMLNPKQSTEIPFILVADPSVTPGVYTLNATISYTVGTNTTKRLDLNIGIFVGGKGTFDISVQDSSQVGSVSLSVANIGSNPATSVSVSIPQQRDFITTGSSSSFVGNLNPGDFTLVTFQLTSGRNATASSGFNPNFNPNASSNFSSSALRVDISYTDTNSNRQIVEKEVPLRLQAGTSSTNGRLSATSARGQTSSGLDLVIIGVVGIVLVVVLIKYGGRIKNIIRKKK